MNILAYEPEILEREVLKALLTHEGLSSEICAEEVAFNRQLKEHGADMVIVGMRDPAAALALCASVRERCEAPLVALGRLTDEDWLARLYEAGVDEVLHRPIAPRLLIARIDNLRRRALNRAAPKGDGEEKMTVGPFKLYPALLELHKQDHVIRLTPLQTRLLYHLMVNAGQIVSKTRLEEKLWGSAGDVYGDSIKTHVFHLRKKLEDEPSAPQIIQTIKGIGYRFERRAMMGHALAT